MFGCFLVAKVIVWTAFISHATYPSVLRRICPCGLAPAVKKQVMWNIRQTLLWSGTLFVLSGLFLFLMVFFFLRVDRLDSLWKYAVTDITQLQHIAISMVLFG